MSTSASLKGGSQVAAIRGIPCQSHHWITDMGDPRPRKSGLEKADTVDN